MCSILGTVSKKNKINEKSFKYLNKLMKHRGPDDQGYWKSSDEKIILSNQRLSINDVSSNGKQPMIYDEMVIVFNGEIYNYIELREELKKKKITFETNCDTEVFLKGFKFWGTEIFNKIDGMFAVCIYDLKKNLIYFARDIFGEKPLLYSFSEDNFIFSSEFKPILFSQKNVKYDINQMLNFLNDSSYGLDNNRETVFNGVSRLLPGEFGILDIKEFKISIQNYFSIKDIKISDKEKKLEYKKIIQESYDKSLECRLRGDVKKGIFFSGGLDSSINLFSILNKFKTYQNITILSGIFGSEKNKDDNFIKEINKDFKLDIKFCHINDENIESELKKLSWYTELPIGSLSQYAQWKMFEFAKQNKIKIMIDGQGADEIFGGYQQYFNYLNLSKDQIKKINLDMPNALFKKKIFFEDFISVKLKKIISKIFNIGSNFLFGINLGYINNVKINQIPNIFKNQKLKNKLIDDTFSGFLQVLLRYGDRISMAHSVENRLPYLNRELHEKTYLIDENEFLKNLNTKNILKTTFGERLPLKLLNRKDKQGFLPPQEIWFEKLSIKLNEYLDDNEVFDKKIWDIPWWKKLITRYEKGEKNLSWVLWKPYVFYLWKKNFFDKMILKKKEANLKIYI